MRLVAPTHLYYSPFHHHSPGILTGGLLCLASLAYAQVQNYNWLSPLNTMPPTD
jgi:hypothetical protein